MFMRFLGTVFVGALLASAASAQTPSSAQIAAAIAQQQGATAAPSIPSSAPAAPAPAITTAQPTSQLPVQTQSLSPTQTSTATGTTLPPVPPLSAADFITAADGTAVQVFGSQLFTGAFSAARPTRQSNYLIQPGDQIAVRIFGAVNVDAVQTVDTSGDLFIQGVGPVKVGNSPVNQLQSMVEGALRKIYTSTVGVYVDVLQGGTLGIYLAGDVRRPGRYLGTPGDSILYFVDQAGGINPSTGSFRNVSVRRGGRTVATYDFYDFVTKGRIQPFAFEEGDTIYVAQRGATVAVTGDAVKPFAFEARAGEKSLTGAELVTLSQPLGTVTAVGVTSVMKGVGQAAYFPIEDFAPVKLMDGDHVIMKSDVFTKTISVSIQGDLDGPSIYVLARNTLLSGLLSKIPLEGTDIEPTYVHIQRQSTALLEKAALDKALDDLQRTILTTPTLSSDASQSVTTQATTLAQFITQAKAVQPSGIVAVYTDGKFNDVHLENGDVIIFPKKTDVVMVAGEVLNPGAFVHAANLAAVDYVNRAGGFSPNANRGHLVLQRADGTALVVNGKTVPRPGDQIVVVPQVISRNFLLFKDLTTIIFQLATSVAAVIAVTK